jgi:intein/homing endonuclease
MKFDKNLAAIHGYLCSDGYVIKNPSTQKHKYYYIGLRNFDITLLKDFQDKFSQVFGIQPIITTDGRAKIQNKGIYNFLTKDFSYYSYEWTLPKMNKENLKFWLRAFFDSEGWVENQPRQSRLIGVDCCNEAGLESVRKALLKFGISSSIKKRKSRTLWRLTLCGHDDILRFSKFIGFLHPAKKNRLAEALSSYMDYTWNVPSNKNDLLQFILQKGKKRVSRNEIRLMSIKHQNMDTLKKALNKHHIHSKLFGPWKNSTGSTYYCLIISIMEVNTWKNQH